MAKNNLLKGNHPDVISANVRTLMDSGKHTHQSAMRCAMCHANKTGKKKMAAVAKKVAKPDPELVKLMQ